jgi:hypothetical protein
MTLRKLILAAAIFVIGAGTFLVPTVLSSPASGAGFALSSARRRSQGAGRHRGAGWSPDAAGPQCAARHRQGRDQLGPGAERSDLRLGPGRPAGPHRRVGAAARRRDRHSARAGEWRAHRGLGEPAGGRRRARHRLHAVPAVDLEGGGGRGARPAAGPVPTAGHHGHCRLLPGAAAEPPRTGRGAACQTRLPSTAATWPTPTTSWPSPGRRRRASPCRTPAWSRSHAPASR